jgi:hypothetical protein
MQPSLRWRAANLARGAEPAADAKADYTLHIARGNVELAPIHVVSTTLYNGRFPAGFRFLHSHVIAGSDLTKGTYSVQAAPVYIEPKANVGAYDREVLLVLKEFEPSFSHGGGHGYEVPLGRPEQGTQTNRQSLR